MCVPLFDSEGKRSESLCRSTPATVAGAASEQDDLDLLAAVADQIQRRHAERSVAQGP